MVTMILPRDVTRHDITWRLSLSLVSREFSRLAIFQCCVIGAYAHTRIIHSRGVRASMHFDIASSRRFDVSDVTSLATHHMQLDIGFLSGLCRNGVIYTCDANFACVTRIRALEFAQCDTNIRFLDRRRCFFDEIFARLTRDF